MFRSPQDPLGFNDSLEGLMEPSKDVILTFIIYYSERIQIKVRNGKSYTGQSPGETRHNFQLSSPRAESTFFAPGRCVIAHIKYCQPWKFTRDWLSWDIYWVLVR